MKFLIVLALVAAAAAAPPTDSKNAEIVVYENNNIGVEKYDFKVQTSDGKTAQESGVLKNVGNENEAMEVRGAYSYVGNDGVLYEVTYIANEDGFQAKGAHLPV